jgi:pyruvate dehydrogenase E1 component alpha subunit
MGEDFFEEVTEAGHQLAAEIRAATFALENPPLSHIFDNVYAEQHPLIDEQRAWLSAYEQQMGDR